MYNRRPRIPLYSRRRRLSVKRRYVPKLKARKRQRTVKRSQFGYSPGSSISNQSQQIRDQAPFTMSTKRLYVCELTRIARNAQGDAERRSLALYLSGFKFCCEINNNRSQTAYFHYALLTYKNDTSDAERFDVGAANDAKTENQTVNFFRDQGLNNSSRATGVNDGRTGIEMHCLPINTDAYKILTHKKYKLGPNGQDKQGPDNNNGSGGPNQRTIMRWIRLKRQIRYTGIDNTTCQNPIFLVMWCSALHETGGDPPLPQVDRQVRVITYFRNLQN